MQRARCHIVNIYSKYGLISKRILWEILLMSKSGFRNSLWCVADDFNSVKSSGERIGLSLKSSEAG